MLAQFGDQVAAARGQVWGGSVGVVHGAT